VRKPGEIKERFEFSLKLGKLMRAFARIGSAASVYGRISVGLRLSVLDAVCLGSSASVGHSARLGSGFSSVCLDRLDGRSVLNAITLGISLSLREQARCGSGMSLFGTLRFGGSMSAMEVGLLASSVSLGSFARVSSNFSAAEGFAHGSDSIVYGHGFVRFEPVFSINHASWQRTVHCGCCTCGQQCLDSSPCVDRVFFLS
jgi:hypothetical protein